MNDMPLQNSAIMCEGGYFASEKMVYLNEILMDFDPTLELQWIPTDKRLGEDKHPYRIVHNIPNKPPYVVMYVKETDDPQNVLARIFAGDMSRNDVQGQLDAQNAAAQAFMLKKHYDELQESHDQMHFLLTNRSKNYVNWIDKKTGKKYKLDSERRRRPL